MSLTSTWRRSIEQIDRHFPDTTRVDKGHAIVVRQRSPIITADSRATLVSGDADIAVFNGRRSVRRYAGAVLIGETPCSLYGSARWAQLAANNPAAVATLPFVLPLEGTAMEQWVLYILGKSGIKPHNVVARSQFMEVIRDMVMSGTGVAMLFDEQIATDPHAARAARLGPKLESCSCVLLAGKRARTRAAKPFVTFLHKVLSERPRHGSCYISS